MPLTGNVGADIKTELSAGKPRAQAIAIALSESRRKGGSMDKEDLKDNGADEATEKKKKKKVVSRSYSNDAVQAAQAMVGK